MTKLKTKRFILILMLILLTISFCGCAEVRAMTITNEDGTIEEQVYVSLDVEAITKAGQSVSQIKADISSTATKEGGLMVEKLNAKIDLDSFGATQETKQILNSFRNGIQVLSNNWDNNTSNNYVVSIKFKNIDVYKYYYDITEDKVAKTKTEKHFFYNKLSFEGSTMYLKHHELYERVNAQFAQKYSNLINSESNQLLYTYTTDIRRQHSNADFVSKVDGKYYHTWIVEDVENEKIMFHYNIANPGNWIMVAIGVSLVVCGVLFIVNFTLNKRKLIKQNQE